MFLTANCDTFYFLGFVDLSDGPMVIDVPKLEAPSAILGTIDDMWFRWVTDFGLPGPDRGEGGRYLIVGPGYDGPLPDSGFHVAHSRTNRALVLGRAFMVDNDPSIPADAIRKNFRISPYAPGAQGTAVATFLAGDAPLGAASPAPETKFVEASGRSFNTMTQRARRQGQQLAPDRAGQGLVHPPSALLPGSHLLRQDLAAHRDRADLRDGLLATAIVVSIDVWSTV